MSRPTSGRRSALVGRLIAPPNVENTAGAGTVVTLRVSVRDAEEYVLVAFGTRTTGLRSLTAGRIIYAEGCWQACEGGPPELIVTALSPLTAAPSAT